MSKCPRCLMSTCDCTCTQEELHSAYSGIAWRYTKWLYRAVAIYEWCKREQKNKEHPLSAQSALGHVMAELDVLIKEIVV